MSGEGTHISSGEAAPRLHSHNQLAVNSKGCSFLLLPVFASGLPASLVGMITAAAGAAQSGVPAPS